MDTQNNSTSATANKSADRLLHPQEAKHLLGSTCKTNHTLLRLARMGKISAVRLGPRSIRYRESSVLALVAGKDAAA